MSQHNPITVHLINDEGKPTNVEEDEEEDQFEDDDEEFIHHRGSRNHSTNRDSIRSVQSYMSNKTEEEIQDIKSRYSHMSVLSIHEISNSAGMTMFLLINTMIGSGILNQPYVFMKSGLIGGLVGFVLAGLGTWAGLLLLTKAGISCNVLEYSGLAKHAFGVYGEYCIDLSIILLTFGAQLGYILIVGETSADLLSEWGCSSIICKQQQVTILAVALFMAPICMFRHFGHLAFLALFSILAIVLCVGLVVVGGPMQHVGDKQSQIKAINAMGAVTSIGSIVFSLSCSAANFQAFISTKLEHQNMRSWSWITGGAVMLGAIMCAIMGVGGYLSFGDDTDGEILNNFPGSRFYFFKAMVVTHLILYIPVNFVIMRYSIVKLTTGKKSESLPWITHTILTLLLLTIITGIVLALLASGQSSGAAFALILNITGGIGGSLSTFILPAAIFLKVMSKGAQLYNTAYAVLAMGIVIAFTVTVFTIIDSI